MTIPGLDLDITEMIKAAGYLGVWSIVFAESGILIFFFLPGDSLLFTAGFVASLGYMNIAILSLGAFVAAMLGNMLGYELGKRFGLKAFERFEGRILKREHLELTQNFYARHGAMAVISARFMPIVRTFVPFLAGVAQVDYKKFMIYSAIGAFLWGVCLTVAGYAFGRIIPPEHIDSYLLPIILAVIIVSFLPSIWHLHRERKRAAGE
jgi:membrane-associated protein